MPMASSSSVRRRTLVGDPALWIARAKASGDFQPRRSSDGYLNLDAGVAPG